MSYIIAHVKFGNSPQSYPVNCFRDDIQDGDEVVVKMIDGALKYARVFGVSYLHWDCKHTVECLVSEATVMGDDITLPEGDPLLHKGMTRDEDLKRSLHETGWVQRGVTNKVHRLAYMAVNTNRTALILFRKNGIDVQILSGQPHGEMSSNNVLQVTPSAGNFIRQPYRDSPYNVFERTAVFAKEFQEESITNPEDMLENRNQPRVRRTQDRRSREYGLDDIYDAMGGEGEPVYLSDGVWLSATGSLEEK
jgi:hypothetical protein